MDGKFWIQPVSFQSLKRRPGSLRKSYEKRRELPKLRLSFQKPLTVATGNQIPDMRLHSGPFCWTKLADNRFINSVTELYFKQEGPLVLPSVTCRNHFIWLIRVTGEAHGLMWRSSAIIPHCQAVSFRNTHNEDSGRERTILQILMIFIRAQKKKKKDEP